VVLAALAGSARAQSFNVEVFSTTGSPTAPSSAYGAASGQTGTWNTIKAGSIGSPTSITALGLNGAATGVSISLGSNNGSGSGSFGTGDFSALMGDYAVGFGNATQITATVTGLAPGFYRAWVYAALPPAQASYIDSFNQTVYHPHSIYSLVNNVQQDSSNAVGPTTAGTFQINRTHGIVDFKVTAAGQTVKLQVFGDVNYFASQAAMNGLQIVQYTGTRLYVDSSATGTGTGQSWTNAMTTLTEALSVAKTANGSITEIWVANGTYKPTTTTNRSATFTIPSGVKIYGGFAGNETTLAQRIDGANITTLSGDIGVARVNTDNSYNIITMTNCSSSTLLDRLNVVSGRADANGTGPTDGGGAIYMTNSSPRINDCTFNANYGLSAGAIWCQNGGYPVFSNCTFVNNSAPSRAGAIQYEGFSGQFLSSFLYVGNCVFTSNTGDGGAIWFNEGGGFVANCLFNKNSGIISGGALTMRGTTSFQAVNIYNTTFYGNSCNNFGGAAGASGPGTMSISNSIFWNNNSNIGSGANDSYGTDGGGTVFVLKRCVVPGVIVLPGGTIYTSDPQFVSPLGVDGLAGTLDDNFRLLPTSPYIDRGDNTLLPSDLTDVDRDGITNEIIPIDLDGNPRRFDVSTVVDSGVGPAPIVDLGAFESQYVPPCPMDYNKDTVLNLDDLGDFITDYYTVPAIPGGLQPNAPSYDTIDIGYGIPCPGAPDAPAPYSLNAYRVNGFRCGFSPDNSNSCPPSGSPNLDNLGDFITYYYAGCNG
jgi:hypothetical protein